MSPPATGRIAAAALAAVVLALAGARAGSAQEGSPGATSAIFAGGCFWCMEEPFDVMEGVESTTSGYAGGHVEDPSYEQVSSGDTGHREVVRVRYDPGEVEYEELLRVFWRNVDPFDDGGQFCDRGFQYTTAIFYTSEEQKRLAEASKARLQERFEEEIVTPILPAGEFYAAEGYHQDYYREHSLRYKFYRLSCGRDGRLEKIWGDEAGGH